MLIERPDARLGGESIADVFRGVGGEIRASWCGPCFGQGPDALVKGERAITSFNRNWQNRMGLGGEGYLASPSVVAASALAGYMAPPTELGLVWDPDKYRCVKPSNQSTDYTDYTDSLFATVKPSPHGEICAGRAFNRSNSFKKARGMRHARSAVCLFNSSPIPRPTRSSALAWPSTPSSDADF